MSYVKMSRRDQMCHDRAQKIITATLTALAMAFDDHLAMDGVKRARSDNVQITISREVTMNKDTYAALVRKLLSMAIQQEWDSAEAMDYNDAVDIAYLAYMEVYADTDKDVAGVRQAMIQLLSDYVSLKGPSSDVRNKLGLPQTTAD